MTQTGVTSRNHPLYRRGVDDRTDDRRTPAEIFAPLHEQYAFTLDAAASDDNHLLPVYFTRDTDGLAQSWAGERVWCNPPYSLLGPWFAKAWAEMANGCELIVMLVPANRTEQPFWQEYVEPFRDGGGQRLASVSLSTRYVAGRIRFNYPPDLANPKSPMCGSVVLTWRRTA